MLSILERAWSGESFTFEGKYFQYEPLRLNVLPAQQQRPPMWIAGLTLRPTNVPRNVAIRSWGAVILPYVEALQPLLDRFHGAANEARLSLADLEPAFAFHVYVWETDVRAAEEPQSYFQRYVHTRAVGNTKSFAEFQDKELIIVGGPERCIQAIRRLEGWGMRQMLAIFNYGGLPHAQTLGCMERFAHVVMPAL